MKLFIYEHCPFCVKARMGLSLKHLPFELEVMLEGDAETPTRMVGKKVAPILQKDDGSFMPESMDIVHYADQLKSPRMFDRPVDEELEAWAKSVWRTTIRLAVPRFVEADFPELATDEAREAYRAREIRAFGDLDALIAQSPEWIEEINQRLEALEPLLARHQGLNLADFALFPVLRSLTIVEGIKFGPQAWTYLEHLSARTGVGLLEPV
ncbi:glutaredoxin 2 [Frateuria aurantia]